MQQYTEAVINLSFSPFWKLHLSQTYTLAQKMSQNSISKRQTENKQDLPELPQEKWQRYRAGKGGRCAGAAEKSQM